MNELDSLTKVTDYFHCRLAAFLRLDDFEKNAIIVQDDKVLLLDVTNEETPCLYFGISETGIWLCVLDDEGNEESKDISYIELMKGKLGLSITDLTKIQQIYETFMYE